MALLKAMYLLVARPGVLNSRFLCFVKAAKALIIPDNDLNSIAGDIIGDVAKTNIMLN